jgi:hypothetical protein
MEVTKFPTPKGDLTTGAERLLYLAEVLENVVPLEKFALDQWVIGPCDQGVSTPHSWSVSERVQEELTDNKAQALLTGEPVAPCGFAGCAVGWACQVPEFTTRGLRLYTGRNTPVYIDGLQPEQDVLAHWPAVQAFFDLSISAAMQLFQLSHYTVDHAPEGTDPMDMEDADMVDHPTPQEVAARIRVLVAYNKKQGYGTGRGDPLRAIPRSMLPVWVGVQS